MRVLSAAAIIIVLTILLAGCARFPATPDPTTFPPRTLYCEMTINPQGEIDLNKFYFLAIGIDQRDITGPVPVVTGIERTSGWGTISGLSGDEVALPPFYVQFQGGAFAQFRGSTYRGNPFRSGVSEDNRTIWVEIDLSELDPLLGTVSSPIIQVNWITMQTLDIPPQSLGVIKDYDGFGPSGNNYLHPVPITVTGTFSSNSFPGSPNYEPTYGPDETTTADPDIDIASWRVEVRIR